MMALTQYVPVMLADFYCTAHVHSMIKDGGMLDSDPPHPTLFLTSAPVPGPTLICFVPAGFLVMGWLLNHTTRSRMDRGGTMTVASAKRW